MALSDEEIASSLSEPDPSTKEFIFQQTMFRIKDPKASLDFYTRVMGMRSVDPRNTFSPLSTRLNAFLKLHDTNFKNLSVVLQHIISYY